MLQLDERGGAHLPYDRQQCGGDRGQQHSFPDVGYWRTGVPAVVMEYILYKYRGERGSTFLCFLKTKTADIV